MWVFAAHALSAPNPKPLPARIAVFDLDDAASGAPGVGRAVADMLIARLTPSPLCVLYERSRLQDILKEQGYAAGATVESQSLQAGRAAGVTFVIIGKVSEFGVHENSVLSPTKGTVHKYRGRVRLDVRMIRVSTGQILKTWSTTGAKTSYNLGIDIFGIPNFDFAGPDFRDSLLGQATRSAADQSADRILESLASPEIQKIVRAAELTGLVADVDGNHLVLNMGRSAGVTAGDVFRILHVEKTVTDPQTGALLTERKQPVGEAIVVKVEDNFSEADMLDIEPGAAPRVKDIAVRKENAPKESKDEKEGQ